MASSLARFRQQMKPTPEKVRCAPKIPDANSSSATQDDYPVFTKSLFVSAFPLRINEKRPTDGDDADPAEYFSPLRFLGAGRMGQAYLVKYRDFTKYASTTLPSHDTHTKFQVVWAKMDARVLEYVDAVRIRQPFALESNHRSPFMCEVLMSFRSRLPNQILYYNLICDFSQGQKPICEYLCERGALSESGAKFYVMELADALIFIHGFGKIFRRLCMCYLLVKTNGHLILTPYTMCKQNLDCGQACNMLTNNCGDQFYASPEIVFGVDVQYATDWWSFGVILYQMLTSNLPFTGRTLGDLGKAITEAPLEMPNCVSPEATAFIKQLLHRDPRRRLGFGSTGVNDIQRHPFFADTDWRDVRELTTDADPPFKLQSY